MLDQDIQREVDVMRLTGASRREMSYHVARRLLLDKGVRPSTQLIRDYTQLGSTGDIAADLRYFWEQVALQLKTPPLLNIRNLDPALRSKAEELLSALVGEVEARYESEKSKELSQINTEHAEKMDAIERQHREAEASLRNEMDALQEKYDALLQDHLSLSQQLDSSASFIERLKKEITQERAQYSLKEEHLIGEIERIRKDSNEKIEWLEKTKDVLDGEIQFAKSQIEESRQLYKTAVRDLERNLELCRSELLQKTALLEKKAEPFKIKKKPR